MATVLPMRLARRGVNLRVTKCTCVHGIKSDWPLTGMLVQRFAGSTSDDETNARWSRKVRHSPGGEAPASQWREAARMSSSKLPTKALGIGVPGGDTVLDFGKYRDLTYQEVLRKDPAYCEGVVLRASDEGGMDDEFLAFAKFVVEAKTMHAASPAEAARGNVSDSDDGDVIQSDIGNTCLDSEEVEVGKYVGSTFAELFEDDPEYCSTLVEDMMKQGKRGSPLWPLVAYILYRRRVGAEIMR